MQKIDRDAFQTALCRAVKAKGLSFKDATKLVNARLPQESTLSYVSLWSYARKNVKPRSKIVMDAICETFDIQVDDRRADLDHVAFDVAGLGREFRLIVAQPEDGDSEEYVDLRISRRVSPEIAFQVLSILRSADGEAAHPLRRSGAGWARSAFVYKSAASAV